MPLSLHVLDITSRLLEEYSLWPSARRYQERKWIEVLPKKENVLVPVKGKHPEIDFLRDEAV